MQKKNLADMTIEELWELFPIFLTEHKPYWAEYYREEVAFLKTILPSDIQYHHVGSTAVDGIWAKPIIDILLVAQSVELMRKIAVVLQNHGYIVMSQSDGRISLNKGYTEDGFAQRVFHIHIRLDGDVDEIYFRDYLNAHPDVAIEYQNLKLALWKKHEHNRDAYTNAKTDFVKKYTNLAKFPLS